MSPRESTPQTIMLKQQILSLECLCSHTLHFQKSTTLNINLCLFDPDSQKAIKQAKGFFMGSTPPKFPKMVLRKRFLWCLIESDIWTKTVLSLSLIAATTANNYKLSELWIIHSLICSTQCKDNVENTRSLFFLPNYWLFQPDTSLIAWSISEWLLWMLVHFRTLFLNNFKSFKNFGAKEWWIFVLEW